MEEVVMEQPAQQEVVKPKKKRSPKKEAQPSDKQIITEQRKEIKELNDKLENVEAELQTQEHKADFYFKECQKLKQQIEKDDENLRQSTECMAEIVTSAIRSFIVTNRK